MVQYGDDFHAQLDEVLRYFHEKLSRHGPTFEGVDWKSAEAQSIRYRQILKICDPSQSFRLIDYGCGYGGLVDFLFENGFNFKYTGYDPLSSMINTANQIHEQHDLVVFTTNEEHLQPHDYVVASGIFNIKLDIPEAMWIEYCLCLLNRFNLLSIKGFSFNMLTKYSNPHRMRPDLYYADPLYIFDFCKKHFANNVALLHDYDLYDFTILVRKSLN
jgi:SAM-dependent methyltransferase